jgi:hypothetical protein
MFIKKQKHPSIEFDRGDGQLAPALVHYFSNRVDPFKTVLPQMIADADNDQERVLIVESPLSELLDETIRVYREPDWPDQVVVDERHRAFFEAVRMSLAEAVARIDQIEFADLEDEND